MLIRSLVVLGVLMSAAHPTLAVAQQIEIPLAVSAIPPATMAPESGRTDGSADALAAAIRRNDPDITFSKSSAPIQRILELARAGQNVCANYLIQTPERAEILTFSRSTVTIALNRLLVRRDQAHRIRTTSDGAADLAAALADGLRFGRVRGRVYGPAIDAILQSTPERMVEVRDSPQIMQMAAAERVDMFIALPHETRFQQLESGLSRDAFVSFTLPGRRTIDVPNYACTKSDWGRAIIERLDAAHDAKVREIHYMSYFRWLDEHSRQVVRRELSDRGEPEIPDPPEG